MIIKNLRTLIYRKYSRLTLPWHIIRAVNLWYLLRVIQSSVGHQNILLSDWVKYLVSPEGWARWSVPQLWEIRICLRLMFSLNVFLQSWDAAVVSRQYVGSFYAQRIHRKEIHCEWAYESDCWLSGELGLTWYAWLSQTQYENSRKAPYNYQLFHKEKIFVDRSLLSWSSFRIRPRWTHNLRCQSEHVIFIIFLYI